MPGATENSAVTIVRKLKTTPRAAWKAITDPGALHHWLTANGDAETLTVESDMRTGGTYRVVMKSPDGSALGVSGTYRDVTANERLVYTCRVDGAPDESVVTFELTPAGDATELLLLHEGLSDAATRNRYEKAWARAIRRLSRTFV